MTLMLNPGDRTTIEYRDDGKVRDVICLRVPNLDPHVVALDVTGYTDADQLETYAKQYTAYVHKIHSTVSNFETWLKSQGVELEAALPYRKFNQDFIK